MDDVTASIIIACQTAGAVTSINKLGFALGMLGRRALDFGLDSIKVFSDLQEETQKFGIVFAGVNGQANAVVQDLIDNFGQSELSARKMMALTGDMLTGFGLGSKDVLDLSAAMAKMGADIASFSNYTGGAEGATYALTKAMLGETEQAKMLGVAIKTDTPEFRKLEKQAQKTGIYIKELGRTFTASTAQEGRAIAVAATIYEQKAHVLGDFARNQDSIANRSRTVTNNIVQLRAELGGFLNDVIGVSNGLGLLGDVLKKNNDEIARSRRELAFATSYILIDIREGLSIVGAFLKPLGAGLMTTGEMIVNTGDWIFNNWGKIWDNMSDVAIAAGKDILHSWLFIPKLIVKGWIEGYKNIGRLLYKQLQNIRDVRTGKISFNESIKRSLKDDYDMFSGQIDYVINEGIKQFAAIGDNTKRALARAGASPFPWPEFDPSIYFAYTDPNRMLNEIKRKYDAQRSELRESFLKSLPQAEIKSARNNGNNDDNGNPGNEFSSSLKKIADDIFRYRETTQSAILANSLEGARLQSRMMIQNSGVNLSNNPQKITAEQSKKQTTLLEEVRNLLDDFVNNTTPISTRPVR